MLKEIYRYLFRKSALLLNRRQLGSIDGIEKEKMSSAERKEYVARSAVAYKDIVEGKIAKFIKAQEDFIIYNAENEMQLIFGRATINGLSILKEDFENDLLEDQDNKTPQESFDKHKVI